MKSGYIGKGFILFISGVDLKRRLVKEPIKCGRGLQKSFSDLFWSSAEKKRSFALIAGERKKGRRRRVSEVLLLITKRVTLRNESQKYGFVVYGAVIFDRDSCQNALSCSAKTKYW